MARPPRLATTGEAAREIGIAASTLARYVRDGLITPTFRLPSGHMRWDVEDLKRQIRAMPAEPTDEQEADPVDE